MTVKKGHMEVHQMVKGDIEGQAGTTELEYGWRENGEPVANTDKHREQGDERPCIVQRKMPEVTAN